MVPRSIAMASTHVRQLSTGAASTTASGDATLKRSKGSRRSNKLKAAPSDSDCSAETASLSNDSTERAKNNNNVKARSAKRNRRKGSEWEVLEGLKDGQRFERKPEAFIGYLHKKRKWPLKGWHKRYFVVDGGILVYARGPADVSRGRLHGSVDVGLSVVSAKQRRRRIDIDADDTIYHLRAKTHDVFSAWLHVLKAHRLYRQHLLTFGVRDIAPRVNLLDETDKSPNILSPTVRAPQAGFVTGTPGGRLASWSIEGASSLDSISKSLGQAQLNLQQLNRLAAILESQHHDTDVSLEGAATAVKKERRKFGLRKKKTSKCGSVDLNVPHQLHLDTNSLHSMTSASTAPPSPGAGSNSIPNSLTATLPMASSTSSVRPASLPGAESLQIGGPASLSSLSGEHRLREDYNALAKELVTSLKSIVNSLVLERNRVVRSEGGGGTSLNALRDNLNCALVQNEELKNRLARIHDTSDLAEISSVGPESEQALRQFRQSLSYSSSCLSQSEFFDAQEHDSDHNPPTILSADVEGGVIELEGDTSSEAGSLSSEEGSASSDNSDLALLDADSTSFHNALSADRGETELTWSRRTRLPSPRSERASPSLWNLLRKNIGKDLSQISMPVTLNEPLNMLQRLCEELEYSNLLDAASACTDPLQRLCLIAAFAVSPYGGSAHRAASKPFNPLLGETYEAERKERGFRFISEQVSHHPPISACHAESSKWIFWQEARIKTKFWGKSMEFQPAGNVHVKLLTTGDHYSWNKVTSCVHNLFAGQRWVDQYGDMIIQSHNDNLSCKLTFVKASGWSTSRHEVRGSTTGAPTVVKISGRWSEVLLAGEPPTAKCLWRPGLMPTDFEHYYGFTQFAMELNEMEPGMPETLPPTDTRLRPDQRALEEGDIDSAEKFKAELEDAQRERRRDSEYHTPLWFRKSLDDSGVDIWSYNNEYWKSKEAGFPHKDFIKLW